MYGGGGVADLCGDGADWGADFLLDAGTVNDCDFVEWGDLVARDFLSFGRIDAGGGVRAGWTVAIENLSFDFGLWVRQLRTGRSACATEG